MNNATTIPSPTMRTLAVAIVIILGIIWTLGMGGVIHLSLALVWIIPFTCLIIGAMVILWEGGAFDTR
jgi:type IV secretory pathway VirB2 component (pilin)